METCTKCEKRAIRETRKGVLLCPAHTDHTDPAQNYGAEPWRAPEVKDGDEIVIDECGRVYDGGSGSYYVCGRSHWFRVYRNGNRYVLAVHHGGGNERFLLGHHGDRIVEGFLKLDSLGSFHACWALMDIYHDSARGAADRTRAEWAEAHREKRIKVRRRGGMISTYIQPKITGNAVEIGGRA